MKSIHKLFRYISDPKYRFIINDGLHLYSLLSDEKYLKKKFKNRLGYELNLNSPSTFNEKLQWLKIHDRNPLYHTLVDKIKVKEYVSAKIGEEYIIPTYGIWNKVEEIDWKTLPDSFVLKVSHDSGGVFICKDKNKVDLNNIASIINEHLRRDYYLSCREWPYKNLERKVLAEQLLVDNRSDNGDLIDYKFYCFNGCPTYLYVSQGLSNHSTAKISFLDLDWNLAPFGRDDYDSFVIPPEKPPCLQEMIDIASTLANGMPFVRVDLYNVNNKIYFSELTLYPCSGMMPFSPPEYDKALGDLLDLTIEKP